jgi:hypothetical protein
MKPQRKELKIRRRISKNKGEDDKKVNIGKDNKNRVDTNVMDEMIETSGDDSTINNDKNKVLENEEESKGVPVTTPEPIAILTSLATKAKRPIELQKAPNNSNKGHKKKVEDNEEPLANASETQNTSTRTELFNIFQRKKGTAGSQKNLSNNGNTRNVFGEIEVTENKPKLTEKQSKNKDLTKGNDDSHDILSNSQDILSSNLEKEPPEVITKTKLLPKFLTRKKNGRKYIPPSKGKISRFYSVKKKPGDGIQSGDTTPGVTLGSGVTQGQGQSYEPALESVDEVEPTTKHVLK